MTAHPQPHDLATIRAELLAHRARLATQEAEIARLKRRRRLPRRLRPVLLAALLVALVPLATLAANPVFSDLGQAAPVHRPNIQAIGNAGITTGQPDPDNPGQFLYYPTDTVTRQEMASFLARTAGLGGNPPVANAAQLGGQPAAAYARLDTDAQFASLTVTGSIHSPRFRVSQIFGNTSAGPLPKESTSLFTKGGALLVFVTGSGFRPAGSGSGLVQINIQVDGQIVGVARVYTNEAGSHRALNSGALLLTNIPAGDHTLTLTAASGTMTDPNDYFGVTVLELPLDCSASTCN